MLPRPRYSMKGILGIIAALSVLLAAFVSQNDTMIIMGLALLLPVVGGCGGYLMAGRNGVGTGIVGGLCVFGVISLLGFCLYVIVALLMLL